MGVICTNLANYGAPPCSEPSFFLLRLPSSEAFPRDPPGSQVALSCVDALSISSQTMAILCGNTWGWAELYGFVENIGNSTKNIADDE